MRLIFGIFFCLLTALMGLSGARAESDTGPGSLTLTAGFDAWATALEADSGPRVAWNPPFGAPRPADLSAEELKIVLALRRLVQNEEMVELAAMVDQVVRRQESLPAQMRFWVAYSQDHLEQHSPSLTNLEHLLRTPEGWRNLEIGQRAWTLTATCDQLFHLERRAEAAGFYMRLAASPLKQLHLWGNFQLAALDFLARQFGEASRKYNLVCQSEMAGSWREHACSMAEIAGQMEQLLKEGEPYGVAAP